ncbi:uncharacterized protein LOC124491567 [Dermatophagoides farinae]|uniref:Uncharacterized protein n=1 Tax=Dermatophagoides farinae TaxID=6954 RepID=A0A922ID92_DERFA|nr:uncharacterized protein LOC124491567 [Dermatophagoides farinae]KAH7642191.1 hypothetical protein HUG17_5236 [Dermatophagoides farinae]KAH9529339.1 hypothetical protein DERF_003229 [Dermatophagoides farinae]
MSKGKSDERIQETSILFKNPFVSETNVKEVEHQNLKRQVLEPKISFTVINRQQTMLKEANETIQDAYCYLKARESELSLRSATRMSIRASHEYILYYKIGHLYIRPMGVFSGVLEDDFHEIIPYSFRRSNGELDWLNYLPNDLTLAYDYNFITGTSNGSPKSVMIMTNDSGKVFVFGEMYRGFVFGSPSTLELKGRLYMGQTSTDGSVKEDSLKSSCVIEVNKGSMVVFICDFSHIIILPDRDCQMTVKALLKESEKSLKKSTKTPDQKSKRSSRKKPKNIKISIREITKTTTTTAGETLPLKTEINDLPSPDKILEKMDLKIPMKTPTKVSNKEGEIKKKRSKSQTSKKKNREKSKLSLNKTLVNKDASKIKKPDKRSKSKIKKSKSSKSKLGMFFRSKKSRSKTDSSKSLKTKSITKMKSPIKNSEKMNSANSSSTYKTIQSEDVKMKMNKTK